MGLFLIWLLAGAIVVLTISLYRTGAEVKKLKQKLEDLRIHEWNMADASEQQRGLIRHDIKGILNRIQALSHLLRMVDGKLSEEQEEQLDLIERQCLEGKAEIDRMLPKEE